MNENYNIVMKRLFSLSVLFAFFALTAFAQNSGSAADAPATQDGPVATFETIEMDYGVIERGSDPLRIFKFTNTGNEPLEITHAKGSCGCTVPEWPKQPIFPGESGEIKVKYDTKRIGKFMKRVTLTTNEDTKARVLTIKGEVLKDAPQDDGVPASAPSIFAPANSNSSTRN